MGPGLVGAQPSEKEIVLNPHSFGAFWSLWHLHTERFVSFLSIWEHLLSRLADVQCHLCHFSLVLVIME